MILHGLLFSYKKKCDSNFADQLILRHQMAALLNLITIFSLKEFKRNKNSNDS